jgi:hypothetical protein
MKTTLAWIKNCDENHRICAKYRCEQWPTLPSRVIDVGTAVSLNELNEPRLFVSNGQRAPYVCLSHCWGDTASGLIKTTKDNLELRKMQIPLDVLPKTFADAVKVARAMSIRYLWIDSICIVQDDMDDWEIQAAAMASIYKNAYVTIAATASKDSNGGCLRPRKPFVLLERPPVELKDPMPRSDIILLYPGSMHTIFNLIKAPLNTRGWTFQEMALSCRTLHFCEDQIVWQCLERTVTEDGVIDTPGFNKDHKYATLLYRKLGIKGGIVTDVDDIESQRICWWGVVKEFTSRKLTKDTDRLPALSGIINHLQERTGDTPIAGLWKNDLPYGLLWQSASRTMTRPQAQSKVPSWSWVSLDGPIQNYVTLHGEIGSVTEQERRSTIQDQVVIVAAEVHHSGPIPSSPIMGGIITLYGRLQPALRSSEDTDHRLLTERRDQDISFYRLLAPPTSGSLDIKSRHVGWCTFDQDAPPLDQVLWCLEISISERESEASLDPFEEVPAPASTHDVLILASAENNSNTFRRLGVGMIHTGTETFKSERLLVNIK